MSKWNGSDLAAFKPRSHRSRLNGAISWDDLQLIWERWYTGCDLEVTILGRFDLNKQTRFALIWRRRWMRMADLNHPHVIGSDLIFIPLNKAYTNTLNV